MWYFWVKIKADPEAAADYEFCAKIENTETGLKIDCNSVSVSPVDSSVDEIIKSGNCLVMNNGNIEKMRVEYEGHKQYSGKVKISLNVVKNQ